MEAVVNIPGGGLPTEPADDPADRYERAIEALIGEMQCPNLKCQALLGAKAIRGFAWGNRSGTRPGVEWMCPCGAHGWVPLT